MKTLIALLLFAGHLAAQGITLLTNQPQYVSGPQQQALPQLFREPTAEARIRLLEEQVRELRAENKLLRDAATKLREDLADMLNGELLNAVVKALAELEYRINKLEENRK